MPTRSEQDFILRQLRAVAQAIARALGFRRTGQSLLARQELDAAWSELLGQLGPVIARADPATAAALVGDPRRLLALAELRAEQCAVDRERDPRDDATRAAIAHGDAWALAVTLEALAREPDVPGGAELAARLRPLVPDAAIADRHRATLARVASVPRSPPATHG